MSEMREPRTNAASLPISGMALLWIGLAAGYLAASATGQRALALAAIGLMVGAIVAASGRRVAGIIAGVALAAVSFYWADSMFFFVYVPPLAAFAFMAFFFQRTLQRGAEPLITRVARIERPDLPMEVALYTRKLTQLWSLCFLFLFFAALLLAPAVTLDSWSRWVQGLGYLMPGTLFLGEYAYRHHRFRDRRHSSLRVLVAHIVTVIREEALQRQEPISPDRDRR
jgi:uncharacterized membrane protein